MEKFIEERHYTRDTPFEQRYLPLIESIQDPVKKEALANQIAGKHVDTNTERLDDFFNPHQGFVDAYNQRKAKEVKEEVKKKSQHLYNDDGKRFGRIWDYSSYKTVHDPLSILLS